MGEVSVLCSHCGKRNDIIAIGVPGMEAVVCSHCKGDMGRLDQLQIQSDKAKSGRQHSKSDG